MPRRIPYLLTIVLAFAVPVLADTPAQDQKRMEAAAALIVDATHASDKGIPDYLLKKAQCVALIPGEKKVAFIVGGNYGKGLVTCRTTHGWSAPLFVSLGGGSVGLQAGFSDTDYVLIFRSKGGLEKQLSDKFQIGATAEGAAGPVGREAGVDTDVTLRAGVVTYSRSKGVYAGVDLKGAILQPDDSGNQALYGNVNRIAVLTGHVPPPPAAQPLLKAVASVAGTRPLPPP